MARADFEYILNNVSAGVNFSLRDGNLGYDSKLWSEMKVQHDNDAVTDIFMLMPYKVRRNDKKYNMPFLTVQGDSIIANPFGVQVADIILDAPLQNCSIVQYSINPYQVGHEEANNRVSFAVLAHFDVPDTIVNTRQKVIQEINDLLIVPIHNLLQSNGAGISQSAYNFGEEILSRAELEELLMYGEGFRFTDGLFFQKYRSAKQK